MNEQTVYLNRVRELAIVDFVLAVNARAEANILAGKPVEGAHHRAMTEQLAQLGIPLPALCGRTDERERHETARLVRS